MTEITTTRGAASVALETIREALEGVAARYGWEVQTTDNRLDAWMCLFAPETRGIIVCTYDGDNVIQQARRSLVVEASIAIIISSRRFLQDPALGKISQETGAGGLLEVHDAVKGCMLNISIPEEALPNPCCNIPTYRGSQQYQAPEGLPLDAIEQRWGLTLRETFSEN